MEFTRYETIAKEAFEACLQKLEQRARRLKIEPLVSVFVGGEIQKKLDSEGCYHNVMVYSFDVETRLIKLGDYQFHGSVHRSVDPDGVAVFTTKSRDEEAGAYLSANTVTRCDHCNTNRVRNDSFLLRKGTEGKYILVGSTCVKDFTGHSPKGVEFHLDVSEQLEEACRGGMVHATHHSMFDFVEAAYVTIMKDNRFVSSKMVEDQPELTPTWSTVLTLLAPANRNEGDYVNNLRKDLETAQVDVQAIVNYIKALPETSDYNRNLLALMKSDYIEIRRYPAALVASAVWGFIKASLPKVPKVESVHVGTVNQRTEFTLTLNDVNWYEGQFGWSGFHKFTDEAGNAFEWKTSNSPCSVGETVKMKATVKEHTTYNGKKITVIARGTVLK